MGITAKENSVGAWAFLIGVILAVSIGITASFFSIPSLQTYSSAIYARSEEHTSELQSH